MKHLKKLQKVQDYEAFLNSEEYILPNITYVVEGSGMQYGSPIKKKYYKDINQAISDINNNTIGTYGSVDNEEAVCELYIESGVIKLFLIQDVEISSTIQTNKRFNLNLNGKTITSTADCFLNLSGKAIIDGTVSNSKIICNISNIESLTSLLKLTNTTCIINGGEFINTSVGNGSKTILHSAITLNSSKLTINNASINNIDNSGGYLANISTDLNSVLYASNCNFELTSANGISNCVYSKGKTHLTSCSLLGYANHTANEAGTDYATMSRGMLVEGGNSTLINCTVYGTHSGITIKSGELNIDGGTYDGYSHGGVYLSNGNCNSYIRKAKIQEVDLRGEGMYDDGVAGTNHAGMYVGGASYMKIYMDNCEIYGLQQPIVLKFSSSSSHNNCLYVSNSSINLDYTNYGVRNDGSNEIVFGKGNNFNEDNLRYKRNYTHTEDEY